MLDRAWGGAFRRGRDVRQQESRRTSRAGHRPSVESLEGRALMAAALAHVPDVSVPSQEGYQVALDASASGSGSATFAVVSDNPDIKVSIAQGPFLTYTVSHAPAAGSPADSTITNGKITFQLFKDLAPTTTSLFESFVNAGYYTGKTIHRINTSFSGVGGATDTVIQGGSPNGDGTGNSNLPGTPYGLELNQQLAFTQAGTLAVAHSSAPNSNDVQFFYDTGPEIGLNYLYTVFGQQVAGNDTTKLLQQVATQANAGLGEKSQPISPVIINSASLATTAPYGVIHIDATGASPKETAHITVTSFDPATNTSKAQTFNVTVTANTTPPPTTFTFTPLASPVVQTITGNTSAGTTIQLNVTDNNTKASPPLTKSYAIVSQPAHGALANFNATTGTITYTPNAGYFGNDAFSYQGVLNGTGVTNLKGNVAPVLINITTNAPTDTGAVRLIGTVLVVTPAPSAVKGVINQILITEPANLLSPASRKLNVSINGVTDPIQPLASSIDRIVVYGSKGSENVTIDPAVDPTINVTLDGGHGGKNVLQAGAGPTREHGWFGQNTLSGGTGPNQLIGRAGHVRFFATKTTNTVFAGDPHPGYTHFHQYKGKSRVTLNTPGGTFYKLVNNHLVRVATPSAVHGLILQQGPKSPGTGGPTAVNPTGTSTTGLTG